MQFRVSRLEIFGLVCSAIYILVLGFMTLVDPETFHGIWYLPNLVFVLVVVLTVRWFRLRGRLLTFNVAIVVTGVGLGVTSITGIVLYSTVFQLPISVIDPAGFLRGYVSIYILPVILLFPLGVADNDTERLLVGGAIFLNALIFSNHYDSMYNQFFWMGFCLLGSLLGNPLAVIGTYYHRQVSSP